MRTFYEFLEEIGETELLKERSKAELEGCKDYRACVRDKKKDPNVDDPEMACAGVGGDGKRKNRLGRMAKKDEE